MIDTAFLKQYRYECLLAAILCLSACLNIWNIWSQGITNAYYAAAVKSMLANPAVLFYNSFDAAGFITIDKPPVGLWIQCVSAALLGFSGWALVLPEALAGVGSVALLYAIVSRAFGKPAGLVSALALAVTPIFVAVSRNGTMDGTLIFVILLAVWAAIRAAREASVPYLLSAVILVGIGFNIKMIQAFIVVPVVLACYLLGAKVLPVKMRVFHIVVAVAVLMAVSLSWAAAVDMVPADQRPFIGGSGDNTVLGLIINYNGLHRLENGNGGMGGGSGMPSGGTMTATGGPGGTSSAPAGMQNRSADRNADGGTMAPFSADRAGANRTMPSGTGAGVSMAGTPPGGMSGGQSGLSGTAGNTGRGSMTGGGMDNSGTPGLFRLFGEGLAAQIAWLLTFALIGLAALWRRPEKWSPAGLEECGLTGERGLTALAMGLWLLPGLLYFSFTTGFWHTYYIATIAPPLAALVGIGAVAMYDAWTGGGVRGWIFPVAVLVTGLVQAYFLLYTAEWSGPLTAIVGIGTVVLVAALVYLKRSQRTGAGLLPKGVACAAVAILFIAPLVWSCTPLMYGSGNILPVAGPRLLGQSGGSGMNAMPGSGSDTSYSGLANYLITHSTGETWLVAVPGSMGAGAELIIGTGKPVMSLGGFSGSDQVLTVTTLKELVDEGKIRFFYLSGTSGQGGGGMNSGNSALFSWVEDHCTAIAASEYGGSTTAAAQSLNPAITGTAGSSGNRTLPGMPDSVQGSMNGMSGMDGNGGMADGQNTLYDCRGYSA
jgi:4-amino-4-deoxy-L-arabinose transferase-like glycosyltransferase